MRDANIQKLEDSKVNLNQMQNWYDQA